MVDGGGGFSVVEPEPAYQKLVSGTADYHGVQYLTQTDYQSVVSGTNFIEPTAWGRHPDPAGRLRQRLWPRGARPVCEHRPGVGVGQPTFQTGWGGTSFVVSPQFNGSTAVIESYLGYRIGLWNPSVYSFAAGANSPVTPLNQAGTGNDNTFYTGNPGQLYNEATGLGVPNLAKFTADLTR